MSPRTVDRDARRRQVVEAAVRVFARQGYATTKVEDIAREAGVAKGTVYLYADDRRDLLTAAFGDFETRLLSRLRAVGEQDRPALDRLAALVRETLAAIEAEPELSRLLLEFWPASAFGDQPAGIDMRRSYAAGRELVRELLAEAARDGSLHEEPPEEAPTVVVGVVEGVVLQWLVDPGAVPLHQLAEPVVAVLVHGLAARPTTARPADPQAHRPAEAGA